MASAYIVLAETNEGEMDVLWVDTRKNKAKDVFDSSYEEFCDDGFHDSIRLETWVNGKKIESETKTLYLNTENEAEDEDYEEDFGDEEEEDEDWFEEEEEEDDE